MHSQLYLLKLSQTTARPSADYAAWVRGYRDNQVTFIKEMLAILGSGKPSGQLPSSREVTPEDEKLAQEMGIADPGEYTFMSPQLVMRDTAQLLVFGIPPFFGDLRIAKPVCYHKIDPALSAQAMKLLDDALADIAVRERDFKARESVRTLQLYAKIYLLLGQPEQAIGKLQTALDKFPKAEEFADTEAMLRGILDGKVKPPSCDNPH